MTEPSEPGEPGDPGDPEVLVCDDPGALAEAAAERVKAGIVAGVQERGAAHFALSGGSSPVQLYRLLASRTDLPWEQVHLWWVDDRFVPPDHPDSNVGLVNDTLLRADEETTRGAPVPASNIHPFPVLDGLEAGHDPQWVADRYAEEIARHLPAGDGRPRFDVMLLGIGLDGHTMSVFAGSPALAPDAPLALAVAAPRDVGPHLPRLTLRAHAADDARTLLVLVPDGAKSAIVARILEGPRDEQALPAQVARRAGASWLLIRAAAAELRRPPPS